MLKNTTKSQTINGITFTVNEDGSITANGTATNVATFKLVDFELEKDIQYCLSGCPNGGSPSTYEFAVINPTTWMEYVGDYGVGATFTGWQGLCRVRIEVKKGITINNLTFYPMIRLASETDDTYEPYYEGLIDVHKKMSMDLLWENASPTSEFGAVDIPLDLSSYQEVEIHFRKHTGSDLMSISKCKIGNDNYVNGSYIIAIGNLKDSTANTIESRQFNTTTSMVKFEENISKTTTGTNPSYNRIYCIPIRIYGIKGVK